MRSTVPAPGGAPSTGGGDQVGHTERHVEWARLEGMAMVADILIGKDGVMSAQVAKIQEMYR